MTNRLGMKLTALAGCACALVLSACEQNNDSSTELDAMNGRLSELESKYSDLQTDYDALLANGTASSGEGIDAATFNKFAEEVRDSDEAINARLDEWVEKLNAGGSVQLSAADKQELLELLRADMKNTQQGDVVDAVAAKLKADEAAAEAARQAEREAQRAEREAVAKKVMEELQLEYPELDPEGDMRSNFFALYRNYGTDDTVKVMGRFMRAQRYQSAGLPQHAIDSVEQAERTYADKRLDTYRRLQDGVITREVADVEREAAQTERQTSLESSLTPEELKAYEDSAGEMGGGRMGGMLSDPAAAAGMLDRFGPMMEQMGNRGGNGGGNNNNNGQDN